MTTWIGTTGNDTYTGGTGNDSLDGGAGNDTINGGAGNDTLIGGTGNDSLIGGTGNDIYRVDSMFDVIVETTNLNPDYSTDIDTIETSVLDGLKTYSLERWTYVENLTYTGTSAAQLKGNALNNVIKVNSSSSVVVNDTLYGGAGNDSLYGYYGNDSLMGDSGNDSIDGGIGNDMMVGGTGNDFYILDSAGDRVFEYTNGGFDTLRTGFVKDLRLSWTLQVEGLTYIGSTAAALHGNALGNAITVASSPANADTLYGYQGNDTLDGLLGADSLLGGIGDDTYMVDTSDVVTELANEGIDTFVGAKTDIGLGSYATTIENLFYTGTTGAAVKGNALANIVSGGNGNDTVSGLDGNDRLAGGAGADSLTGGNGDDILYGGGVPGYFFEEGYSVPDTVRDTLNGGAGNDWYIIDNDLDIVSETSTGGTLDRVVSSIDNSLTRYAFVEALVLEEGSTAWFGQGGAGNDIVVGNAASNYIDGGSGNDTLAGSVGGYGYLYSSDVVEGGAGDDVLIDFDFGSYYTYSEDTSLFGGSGNDLYVLGDSLGFVGGLDTGGTDTALLISSGSIEALEGVENVVLYGTGGAEDVRGLAAINSVFRAVYDEAYTDSLDNAFDATGNELVNRITGNGLDNLLAGMAGNDTIDGGIGNDTLDGGTGNDSLIGGAGNDTYYVNTGDIVVEATGGGVADVISSSTLTTYGAFANIEGLVYTGTANVSLNNGSTNTTSDYFSGGSGNDTLLGYGGNDTLNGYAGNDSVNGGTGLDSLSGGDGNDSMLGDAGDDQLDGGAGNDTIDGGIDNDVIYGGQGVDSLTGGDGNDQLYSGQYSYYSDDTSANTLRGGNGNDELVGGEAADKLYGDAGNDDLTGGGGNDTLDGGTGNDTVVGGSGADSLLGGDGNDTIYDNGYDGLANTMAGGNGNDNLQGGSAAEKFYGDAGADNIYGYAGNDSLEGGTENDFMQGGDDADTLLGQAGNDSLYGGDGNDLINGGGGEVNSGVYYQTGGDNLWGDEQYGDGSAGTDKFRLNAPTVANKALETAVGSDFFYFNTGTFIGDFNPASDVIEFTAAMVGDGNTTLTTAVKDTVGGTFSGTPEMTIFRTDVAGTFGSQYGMSYFEAADVTAVIGNAAGAFALGAERLFVVDDGTSSAIFQFVSSDTDALVEINELYLVAVVADNAALVATDFLLV
jgi:Ca2+-binding RTX toxin-like protein